MTTTTPKLPTAGDKCYIHSYHKRDLNSMPCTVLEYREEDDEFLVRVAGSLDEIKVCAHNLGWVAWPFVHMPPQFTFADLKQRLPHAVDWTPRLVRSKTQESFFMNVYLKAVRTANADPSKVIVFLRPFNERDDFFDQMNS